jgi:hypothetical protein
MTVSISVSNVLDRRLVELVARDLNTNPGLVEKDWHVVRALGILAAFDHGEVRPAFSGGTALSKGWDLLKRFSEDIDFKVAMPPATSGTRARKECGAYREQILGVLTAGGFVLVDKPLVRNGSRFFSGDLAYPSLFDTGPSLRPHIRVEMTFIAPALPPIDRPIRSLIATAQGDPPEVPDFPFIDLVETAADKLSALAWRVQARQRGDAGDDPTIIRHLHDLAALKSTVEVSPKFTQLVQDAVTADAGRGGEATASSDPATLFAGMLERLRADKLWAAEYEDFVRQVSFTRPGEEISFDQALKAVTALTELFRW